LASVSLDSDDLAALGAIASVMLGGESDLIDLAAERQRRRPPASGSIAV
jgi:hypothetical protein